MFLEKLKSERIIALTSVIIIFALTLIYKFIFPVTTIIAAAFAILFNLSSKKIISNSFYCTLLIAYFLISAFYNNPLLSQNDYMQFVYKSSISLVFSFLVSFLIGVIFHSWSNRKDSSCMVNNTSESKNYKIEKFNPLIWIIIVGIGYVLRLAIIFSILLFVSIKTAKSKANNDKKTTAISSDNSLSESKITEERRKEIVSEAMSEVYGKWRIVAEIISSIIIATIFSLLGIMRYNSLLALLYNFPSIKKLVYNPNSIDFGIDILAVLICILIFYLTTFTVCKMRNKFSDLESA